MPNIKKKEHHEEGRPDKIIFPENEQKQILEEAKTRIRNMIQEGVEKGYFSEPLQARIFGSFVKGSAGKYTFPWRVSHSFIQGYSRTASDIDVIIIYEEDFNPLPEWKLHGKSNEHSFIAYLADQIKKNNFENDIIVCAIKYSDLQNKEIIEDMNNRGFPFYNKKDKKYKNPFIEL